MDIILEAFTYCRKYKGLRIWAYVIMSNHIHCIWSAPEENLSNIIRDFKRYTAVQILAQMQSNQESRRQWMLKRFEFAARSNLRSSHFQFWTHDNHPEILLTPKFTAQKLDYIHLNPVRAGLVENSYDWLYSSARNYMNMYPLIEIDLMDINI